MQALRSVREHFRPSVKDEQRSNFAPYSRSRNSRPSGSRPPPPSKRIKTTPWTCKMVCLAGKNVPVIPRVKVALLQAGLGEKKVKVEDVDCSCDDFKDCIIGHFPKLKGGFEILRCVPMNVAFSPSLLKTVIGCGRIYIRPIQIDLNLSEDDCQKQQGNTVSSVSVSI